MSTASTTTRPVRRDRSTPSAAAIARAVLAAVVVAIVVGILGMHVLSASHAMSGARGGGAPAHGGTSSGGSGSSAGTAGGPARATFATHGADGALPPAAPDPAVVASRGGGGPGMGSMMMICGAMLLSAGAILLALLTWRHAPRPWARLVGPVGARDASTAPLRAGTGPPPAWRFSVIRC